MDEQTAAQFLDRLWRLQTQAQLTNAALARALKCDPSYIRHLRSGARKKPGLEFVQKAARRFPELMGFLLPSEFTIGNNADTIVNEDVA